MKPLAVKAVTIDGAAHRHQRPRSISKRRRVEFAISSVGM
jgi:hypothetical protein